MGVGEPTLLLKFMSDKEGWTDYDQLMNYFALKVDEIARNSISNNQRN